MDYNRQPLPHFTRQICYCMDNLQAMTGLTGQTNWSGKKKKKKGTPGSIYEQVTD